jgi:hypothetical protein
MLRHALVAVVASVALSGCGTTLVVRSACAQAAKCGQLGNGITEDSCVAAWTTELQRLRSLNIENCTKYARATEALFSCRASLTCEQSADLVASPCAQENEDWVVLDSVASGECH